MTTSKILTIIFSVTLVSLSMANEVQMVGMRRMMEQTHGSSPQMSMTQAGAPQDAILSMASKIIPTGIPSVRAGTGETIEYGKELGVSFDKAAQGISILAYHEQDTRAKKLEGEKLQRYIRIGMNASCEYCCSATTMVFNDGSKACGCAHSAAMRGVAAYLIDSYGDKLSDQQILTEVNRFKATYFPRQTVQKVMAASQGGNVDMSALNQLSTQVGGC